MLCIFSQGTICYSVPLILFTCCFPSSFENVESCRCTYLVQKDRIRTNSSEKDMDSQVARLHRNWLVYNTWRCSSCARSSGTGARRQRWCCLVAHRREAVSVGTFRRTSSVRPLAPNRGLRPAVYQSSSHHGSNVPAHVESAISTEQTRNSFDVSGGRADDGEAVAGLPPGPSENYSFRLAQGRWNLSLSLADTNGPTSVATLQGPIKN
jgi:hypothetical protein